MEKEIETNIEMKIFWVEECPIWLSENEGHCKSCESFLGDTIYRLVIMYDPELERTPTRTNLVLCENCFDMLTGIKNRVQSESEWN